ncbi:MAG TPA: YfiR family protein [Rhodanobacter sp.]|nr:YfiR family protein [Rhodanobacter sp.]
MGQPLPPAQPAVSLEYAVKATYLYKLAPFVNWPPTTFATATTPFRICVVGQDPFDDYLDKAVAGRSMGAHPFEVRHLHALTPTVDCQIAFIGRLAPQSVHDALDAVSGTPVLTVTDSAEEGRGGIVQFVIRDGRVAFEVDTAAAARNHLTISSKLLQLAVAVKDGA